MTGPAPMNSREGKTMSQGITDRGEIHFGDRVGTEGEPIGTGSRYKLRYAVQHGQLTWDYSDHSDIGDSLCRAYADDGLEQQLEQARALYEGGPGTGVVILREAEAQLQIREGHARLMMRGEAGELDAHDLRALGRAAFEAAKMIDEAEAAKAASLEIVG